MILGTAIWILPEVGNLLLWGGWFVAILMVLIWTELNNRLSLLRERSQMLGICAFTSSLVMPAFLEWHTISMAPLLLLGSFACFFCAIESKKTEGYVFYTFLLLTTTILCVPQLIWLLPLYAWMTGMTLRTFRASNVSASCLGVLFPLIVHGIYVFYDRGGLDIQDFYTTLFQQSVHVDLSYWTEVSQTQIENLTPSDWQFLSTSAGLFFMSVVSVMHFQHTSLNDRYHVRQAYQMLFVVVVTLWVCLILFSQQRQTLLMLLLFVNAPFLAHYFTLARGRWADIVFILGFVGFVLTLIFNYNTEWILSLIFS